MSDIEKMSVEKLNEVLFHFCDISKSVLRQMTLSQKWDIFEEKEKQLKFDL